MLMKRILRFFLLLPVLFLNGQTWAQDSYYLFDRWPNLRFNLPVAMYPAPDNSKRIFVIEQNGRIKVFKDSSVVNTNDTTTFLSIRSKMPATLSPGTEAGLLSMAFHPNFNANGYVFINYTTFNPFVTYVSRFKLSANNPNQLDPLSEKVIISVEQPFSNHNAGTILFGKDGYLYITMGDGGSGGDPGNRAQNRASLLGKILRIDVDVPEGGPPYAIPPDNPLVGNTQGWRPEIYAWGLRNPWKISQDPEKGTIWIGDVGQGAQEEIDTLRKGANYGWKVMEGTASYSACNGCDTSNYERPILTYGRSLGISVTGGHVYRGQELFKLKGAYFYGDYGSRRIWVLKPNSNGTYTNEEILNAGAGLSSFGQDQDGEIYAVRYASNMGRLMQVRCGPATPSLSTPPKLNVCLGDSIVLVAPDASDVVGYKWSTGDTTQRIVIKNQGVYNLQVQTKNAMGCWSFFSRALKVGVFPPPPKPNVPELGICPGEQAQFTLNANLNYSWSSNGQGASFSTAQAGNFWVQAQDSIGCKSDTTYFSVVQYQQPEPPALSISNGLLSILSPPGSLIEWYLDGNLIATTSTSFYSALESGAYTAVLISPDGCRSQPSNPIIFTTVAGEILQVLEHISFFPNPAGDRVSIVGLNGSDLNKLEILFFDLGGKLVLKSELSQAKSSDINLAGLTSGTYTAKLISGKKPLGVIRLIKK